MHINKKLIITQIAVTVILLVIALEIYARIRSRGFEIIHGYEYKPGKIGMLKSQNYNRLPRNFSSSPHHYTAFINQWGTRGELPDDILGPKYLRVYMMGDSTIFGVGVEDDQTVPAYIQGKIRSPGEKMVKVINAGVPGFSPLDHQKAVGMYVDTVKPVVVVLVIFANDLFDVTVEPESRIDDMGWSRTVKNVLIQAHNTGIMKSPGLGYLYYMGLKRHKLNEHISYAEAAAKIDEAVLDIRKQCKKTGAEFIFAILPKPDGKVSAEFERYIYSLPDRLTIDSINIGLSEKYKPGFAFPDDGHYTAEGNKMIADIVSEKIQVVLDSSQQQKETSVIDSD